MLNKRARVIPVSESVSVVDRVPTQHRDEGEAEKADDQDHFEDREVKLSNAEVFHRHQVQAPEARPVSGNVLYS